MNSLAQPSPKVSVLLSVYNGAKYLHQSIESILHQTLTDFEFIIVDDGSTDETAAIIERFKDPRIIHLRHATNQGLVASLNDGLSRAQGQYIARQDADDISLPNRLEEQLRHFDQDPQLVIVGSQLSLIDEAGEPLLRKSPSGHLNDVEIRWTLLFGTPFAHPTVMIRASTLHSHNLRYDPKMLHAEDYDLWSRLLIHGKGKALSQPLIQYRCHPNQVSRLFATRQRTTAATIAWSNWQRLGMTIPIFDIHPLGSWLSNPELLTPQHRDLCWWALDLLEVFGTQEGLEATDLALLQQRIIRKILNKLTLKMVFEFWTIRLLGRLLYQYPGKVIVHGLKNFREIFTQRT